MLNSSTQICHYFNTRGGCKFGRNCRFSHVKYKPPIYRNNQRDGSSVKKEAEQETSEFKENFNQGTQSEEDGALKNQTTLEETGAVKEGKEKICFTFQKYKKCRFGENCRYLHSIPVKPDLSQRSDKNDGKHAASQKRNQNKPIPHRQEKGRKVCQYFKAGNCKKGDKCRFYHPLGENVDKVNTLFEKELEEGDVKDQEQDSKGIQLPDDQRAAARQKGSFKPRKPVTRPAPKQTTVKRDEASDEDIQKLNKTEREQLKRRLATNDLEIIDESDTDGCYRFNFASSDPDWPYDVKDFLLEVYFPEHYPEKMFQVTLPVDQDLPETVRRYVEVSVTEWTKKKQEEMDKLDTLSLAFRPFLVWLDRNLEDVVTQGLRQLKRELVAKAAGFEFIPAHQLQQQQKERALVSSEGSSEDDSEENSDSEEESDDEPDPRYAPRPLIYRKQRDLDDEIYTGPAQYDPEDKGDIVDAAMSKSDRREEDERKGTEMKLRDLQLRENVATMTFTKVKVVIQCGRCKNKEDISMPAGRATLVSCSKCNNPQVVNFRPAIMHQFSSVMGYLDLDGCNAFDLILQESEFKLGCFNCNKEMKAKSISPGQISDTWCFTCHAKMRVGGESVKFSVLEPSNLTLNKETVHSLEVQKPRKIPKDPAIQLGNPLPYDGTCKHYKKSFRWFRFPCCGKAYPCDVCHEEKEDHEMVLANRMICGHCCKEQPFSLDKPCIACSMSMTKSRTAHWEGGKGCRDKVKMSRNDPQKYSGQSKTQSKKAQEKAKPKEKKTKLRHASA